MNKFTLPALAVVLLTVPQLLDAQRRGGGGRQMQNPIEAILQAADSLELDLTADQTSQLTVMQDQLDETNAPAREAMTALFEQASGGFDQSLREQMQPHRQAIQENNEAALLTVRTEVLTQDQWTTVRMYLEAIRPQRRGGRPPPR
jgi:hypothetical protein